MSGVAGIFLAGLVTPLRAQLPSEGIPSERILTPRNEIDRAIADSRFGLGPVRFTPVVAIKEMTYDNNVFGTAENPTGDFRTVLSAGLGVLFPATPNVFLRAGLYPEYTWYAELVERRFFGGRYDGSFLVFANRLTLDGSAGYTREDVIFSSEAQGRVIRNTSTAKGGAEFRLLAHLFVFGGGQVQQFRFTGPGAGPASFDPSNTDRTDRTWRVELRYQWSDEVRLAAGYEDTNSDFVSQPQLYDNRRRAVIGTVYYDRKRWFLRASGGYSDIKAIHESAVIPFSGVLGSSFASYTLFQPVDVQAFASRDFNYGLSSPYYVATRYGGGIAVRVGWRLKLRGFVSAGTDEYSTPFLVPGGQLVDRRDDVKNYGGGLEFLFSPRIQLKFNGTDDRYTSNVPGYDRSFFRWFISLYLGGNLLQ